MRALSPWQKPLAGRRPAPQDCKPLTAPGGAGLRPAALSALMFAACIAFALTGCSTAPTPGPRIDPALAGLIPSNTTLMAGARLEVLRKAPIYDKALAHRSIPQGDQFTTRIGINQKDLWELLYVSNGKSGAILGHGMFSDEGEPKLQQR